MALPAFSTGNENALHRSASVSGVVSARHGAQGDAAVEPWRGHEPFYAAVQALLYALCYHMHGHPVVIHASTASTVSTGGAAKGSVACDKVATGGELRRHVAQEVVPLCHSYLQPLSVCLPSIAAEFVWQLAALPGLPDLSDLVPAERARGAAGRPFEMFFPFDPYLLPLSRPLLDLKRTYRSWRHGQAVRAKQSEAEALQIHSVNDTYHDEEDASIDMDGSDSNSSAGSKDSADIDLSDAEPASPVATAPGMAVPLPCNPFAASQPMHAQRASDAQAAQAHNGAAGQFGHSISASDAAEGSSLGGRTDYVMGTSYASSPHGDLGAARSPDGFVHVAQANRHSAGHATNCLQQQAALRAGGAPVAEAKGFDGVHMMGSSSEGAVHKAAGFVQSVPVEAQP